MLIKFTFLDPLFEQKVELLKLQFRTGAASKAARKTVENYYNIERKVELYVGQIDSMQAEIDRLRLLIEINKESSISTKIAHLRSLRSQKVH
jgi:hypothetical protein